MTQHTIDNDKNPNHVFIVDDKKSNLSYLETLLNQHGFLVSTEHQSALVLNRLKTEHPNLILLDVIMPDPDGFALCEQLRNTTYTAHIPIIFMTALQDDSNKIKGFELGAVDYILKPFQEQEIIARLRTHLTLSYLRQQLQLQNLELQKINHNLAHAMQHRDEFLANMSHELRTPLNAMLNMAESLKEQVLGDLNDRQSYAVNIIAESGDHLLKLINNVLDLSRISTQQFSLSFDRVPVKDLCESCIQNIKKIAEEKNITIRHNVIEKNIYLNADGIRLKQVLLNLLSNAIKFSSYRSTISLIVRFDEIKEYISFTVEDQGIGIPTHLLPHIFQPFVQLNSGLTKTHSGTGLGLTLASYLVDMHGGSIHVTSLPEQGTQFTVYLPWSQQHKLPTTITPAHVYTHLPHKIKILIADDHVINIEHLTNYLLPFGYQIITAYNGHEALEKLNLECIDLAFIDLQMPLMTGREILQQLRLNRMQRPLPVLIMSALNLSDEAETCLAAGAIRYQLKPLSGQQIFEFIATALKQ
jgi:signal transduction histidine kinase